MSAGLVYKIPNDLITGAHELVGVRWSRLPSGLCPHLSSLTQGVSLTVSGQFQSLPGWRRSGGLFFPGRGRGAEGENPQQLLCARVASIQRVVLAQGLLCTRHLADIFSFYLQNSMIWGSLSPFNRRGNWGLERFSDFFTVAKLVNCRAEIHSQSHPSPKARLSPTQR